MISTKLRVTHMMHPDSGGFKIRYPAVRLRAFATICVAALPILAGCQADFKQDGGVIGKIEDSIVTAPNRQWQTYRAAFFLTLISAVAESELKDVNSVSAFYYASVAVKDDINNLAGHVFPQTAWYSYNLVWIPSSEDPKTPGRWVSPDDGVTAKGLTTAIPTTPPVPQTMTVALLPCPSYASVDPSANPSMGCGSWAASNPYRFVNYVGLFESDLPPLNDHLFKASAAAIQQDKFIKLVQDTSKGGTIGGPVAIVWRLLPDIASVFGEVANSEIHLAAAWRSEADNSAALSNSGAFPCKANTPTSDPTRWINDCILQATTEAALSATHKPSQQDGVPVAAFGPLYASIRKSCAALQQKLPTAASLPTPEKGAPPAFTRESMDCASFIFVPNVYRADYQAPQSRS